MQRMQGPDTGVTLILMKGHPATGKSALAQTLARQLGWPVIDKDDIKDHTVDLPGGNELAYRIMWQVVERQLQLGISVIADSPLSYPVGYATGRNLATEHGATLWVVETRLDEHLWQQRLDARANQESSHKTGSWQAMQQLLARYNGCWQYPVDPAHHLVVDTSAPVTETAASIFTIVTRVTRKE